MSLTLRTLTFQRHSGRGVLSLWALCSLILAVVIVRPTSADAGVLPELKFSTYFGGSGTEYGQDIAVDKAGNIYVAGTTSSGDFPTTTSIDAPDPASHYPTLFVSKFDPTGATLLYSTVIGTGYAQGIAVDDDGYAYVVGGGTHLPTVNAIQTIYGGGNEDAFIVKLNPTGTALEFSTYLGGSAEDMAIGVALDAAQNVYVVGATNSVNFPTENAYDGSYGGGIYRDLFIARLDASGSALGYSTYYGGNMQDVGLDMVSDNDGNVYITGYTLSNNFPVVNAYQPVPPASCSSPSGCPNAFVLKLNPSGTPGFSTYLGGNGSSEAGMSIAIDSQHSIYVTGYTDSTNFPVLNAYQAALTNTPSAFVTKFNPSGTGLVYSTYLGGTDDGSVGTGIVIDHDGRAAISGVTIATDFPTVKPIQAQRAGTGRSADTFISMFSPDGSNLQFSTYLGGSQSENYYAGSPRATFGRHNTLLVIGLTKSNDFPILNAFQNQRGGTSTNPNNAADDAFITAIALSPQAEPAQAAQRNYFTTDTPTLTWTAVTWAIHYHVQVSSNSAFTGTPDFDGEVSGNLLSITTDALDDGLYYWRVQAQKSDGSYGVWSPVESFTIDAD